jgi:hypothetical protein
MRCVGRSCTTRRRSVVVLAYARIHAAERQGRFHRTLRNGIGGSRLVIIERSWRVAPLAESGHYLERVKGVLG